VKGELLPFDEAGDPENPAVLFLHGWPTSSYLWRELVPMVSPWMRAIAPNLPHPSDLERSADEVRALLDRLSIQRFAVVGHAEGGAIAQILAVRGGVELMVLIDAASLDVRPNTPSDPEAALRSGVVRGERLDDETVQTFLRDGPSAERRQRGSPPGAEDLGRLEIPTLVLWGENDPFLPAELAERLGEALPMAAVALLPGCGHLVTEEASETVLPLVFQYLRRQYLGVPHGHDEGPVTVELGRRPPEDGRW
jgi:pimeloyl-ACP methyl ester carboxylesterase